MRISPLYTLLCIFTITAMACSTSAPAAKQLVPTLEISPFGAGETVYGFFPSPPEVSLQSVFDLYKAMGEHADVILLQQEIAWQDFEHSAEGESARITDIRNQYILAHQNGLDVIFVVDPLNGLNRREFYHLPAGWDASFASPRVRAAFKNYTLRIVREFKPRYLGLASEINTYVDAHPEDFESFLSLYREVYDAVKAESPETQVFVTFQWEDLNNLFGAANEGKSAYEINWETVEAFEPRLDVWVISSYPFVVFPSADQIPENYYTPLLTRTEKPLAVAEGGYTSRPVGPFQGKPEDQAGYLNAIHSQIGGRLDFWIYLLLSDFNLASYAKIMKEQGQGEDIETLGMFGAVGLREFDGTAKPALNIWDGYRTE